MSPGLGLYLDELYFDGYNMKQRQQSVCEKKALEKALLKEQERSKDKQGDTSSLGNETIEMDGDKEDTESLRKKPRLQLDDDDKLVLSVAEQRSSDELQKVDQTLSMFCHYLPKLIIVITNHYNLSFIIFQHCHHFSTI